MYEIFDFHVSNYRVFTKILQKFVKTVLQSFCLTLLHDFKKKKLFDLVKKVSA